MEKKVLQICSYYVGTDLYQNLFHALEDKGLQESIYVFADSRYKPDKPYPKNAILSCCYEPWERMIFHFKHRRVLNDAIKRFSTEEYALSHAHSLFSNGYIARGLKKAKDIPYITAVRNTDVNVFFRWMLPLRKVGLEILYEAEAVIFLSPAYLEKTLHYVPPHFHNVIREKSRIIPNGIGAFWLEHLSFGERVREDKDIRVVYAGDINKNKNITTALEALDVLKEKGYNVSYEAIGKMKDDKVGAAITARDYATHIPFLPKEELIDHYRQGDIFLMPSYNETFGLVYGEAMSQGLPVIYTEGEGFDRQFPEGQVGYSVNPKNPEEIARKIIACLEDEDMGKRAVEGAKTFSWEKIAEDYLALYKPYIQ